MRSAVPGSAGYSTTLREGHVPPLRIGAWTRSGSVVGAYRDAPATRLSWARKTATNLRDSPDHEGGSRTAPTGEWARGSRVFIFTTTDVGPGRGGRGMPSPLQDGLAGSLTWHLARGTWHTALTRHAITPTGVVGSRRSTFDIRLVSPRGTWHISHVRLPTSASLHRWPARWSYPLNLTEQNTVYTVGIRTCEVAVSYTHLRAHET